jgi:hypothetical protein
LAVKPIAALVVCPEQKPEVTPWVIHVISNASVLVVKIDAAVIREVNWQ